MVRHEGAEALGGIATDEVLPVLRTWAAKTMHPGWSGKPVWWRLSCGRNVRLTYDWTHIYLFISMRIRISSNMPMALDRVCSVQPTA